MSLPILKRAFAAFRRHEMTDHAAALVYFTMLALFPGLLVGISLLGLFGQASLATEFAGYLADRGADPTTADAVRSALQTLLESSGGKAGVALGISIVLGLNGASGAFAAAGRALNVVHSVEEDRSFVRRKLVDVATTLVVLGLFLVVIVSLALGGSIAEDLFGRIGLGDSAASIWSVARWPAAVACALLGFGVVYAVAPDVSPRRLRFLTPGAAVGVGIWGLASLGFAVYVRGFGSYGAAYGAAGAVIVLLLWLYITANAFLFGAEVDVAVAREQTAGRGGPPMVTPPPTAENPIGSAPAGR